MPKSVLEQTVDQFRRDLLARERQAASQMVKQYGEAWKRIQVQIDLLTRRYYAAVAGGGDASTFWLYEFERLQKLRRQVEGELYRWADAAEASIRVQQAEALRAGGREAYELMRAAARELGITTDFDRLPVSAIENMIATFQARSPVHLRLQELALQGAQAVEDGLVQGMMLGQGPRVIARNIRDALGQGLSKALVWSRTEPLRAYRTASLETYRANSDVVQGWVWRSARNSRTCAACWSMDGSTHGLGETLDDHPCGRCFAIGKLHGAPDTKETGAQAFAKLTEAQQLEILGPAKYAAWKDGAITFDENPVTGIVGQKWDQNWGSMRYERSLKEIVGKDAARQWLERGYALQSLGAAANPIAQLQFERLSQLQNLDSNEIMQLVSAIRRGGKLPKLKYHFEQHGALMGAQTADQYQDLMNGTLRNEGLRIFTLLRTKDKSKMWYLVDVDRKFVVQYNESRMKYWSFFKANDPQKFLESGKTWWIEFESKNNQVILSKW